MLSNFNRCIFIIIFSLALYNPTQAIDPGTVAALFFKGLGVQIAGCSVAGFTGSLVGSTRSGEDKRKLIKYGTLFGLGAGVLSGVIAGGVIAADLMPLALYASLPLPISIASTAVISGLSSAYYTKLFGDDLRSGEPSVNVFEEAEMQILEP